MIEFLVGSTAYGTLPAIVDPADGITPITPDSIACLVIKNGTNTAETVATDAVGGGRIGVYKWSFAADAPVAGDRYSLVYTVTIAAAPYYYTLDLICVAVMRGTDNSLQPTVSGRTLNVNTDGEGDAVLDTATLAILNSKASQSTVDIINYRIVPISGTITGDAGTTTTVLKTDVVGLPTNSLHNMVLMFTSPADRQLQPKPIASCDPDGTITLSEALVAIPVAGDAFDVYAAHVHTIEEIQSGLATQTSVNDLPTNAELSTALASADDAVLAAISALNNLSAAQVNSELLDVLNVDTFAELSAPPAASSTLSAKLTWLFMWARNKATQSTTERKLYADDGTTVVSTEAVSDSSGTFTKGEAS